MDKDVLNEREFELINIVGASLARNQRALSKEVNLSLGMTNMLLRRLVTKGYIRIKQLNKRKVQYILTPKGLIEKTKKSIKYTIKTIHSITLIKERIKPILVNLYAQQVRVFYVVGMSDVAFLIDIVLKESNLPGCEIIHCAQMPEGKEHGCIILCTENEPEVNDVSGKVINLIHELAKSDLLIK